MLTVVINCTNTPKGYNYLTTFAWMILHVGVLQGDPGILPKLIYLISEGGFDVYSSCGHEKSSNVSICPTVELVRDSKGYTSRYLETGISPLKLQPWLWIILLGFGPFISSIIYTHYLYVGVSSTRTVLDRKYLTSK